MEWWWVRLRSHLPLTFSPDACYSVTGFRGKSPLCRVMPHIFYVNTHTVFHTSVTNLSVIRRMLLLFRFKALLETKSEIRRCSGKLWSATFQWSFIIFSALLAICCWNLDVQNWNVSYIDMVWLKGYAVSCCYRCTYTGNPFGFQSPLSRSRMGVWDGPHTNSLCKASAYATECLQIDCGHNCQD